jgi:hypothetical protein
MFVRHRPDLLIQYKCGSAGDYAGFFIVRRCALRPAFRGRCRALPSYADASRWPLLSPPRGAAAPLGSPRQSWHFTFVARRRYLLGSPLFACSLVAPGTLRTSGLRPTARYVRRPDRSATLPPAAMAAAYGPSPRVLSPLCSSCVCAGAHFRTLAHRLLGRTHILRFLRGGRVRPFGSGPPGHGGGGSYRLARIARLPSVGFLLYFGRAFAFRSRSAALRSRCTLTLCAGRTAAR